jgi:hypothetical protein
MEAALVYREGGPQLGTTGQDLAKLELPFLVGQGQSGLGEADGVLGLSGLVSGVQGYSYDPGEEAGHIQGCHFQAALHEQDYPIPRPEAEVLK